MGEEQRISAAKNTLPIKTMGVAWFRIGVGTLLIITYLIYSFVVGLQDSSVLSSIIIFLLIFFMPLCLSYLLPGTLLFRKTRGAWTTALVILFIDVGGVIVLRLIYSGLYFMFTDNDLTHDQLSNCTRVTIVWAVTYIIPIIILLIDKKNYFGMMCWGEKKGE